MTTMRDLALATCLVRPALAAGATRAHAGEAGFRVAATVEYSTGKDGGSEGIDEI